MKRKTLIWIVIISLLVVLAGGGAYYVREIQANKGEQTSETEETSIQTAVARRGDLKIFSSGTGQLVAWNDTTLQFNEEGTLVELMVSVGDPVSTGDVLARLQVNKSETQLLADVARAKLTVLQDQQALDALYADAKIAAAQALYDLEEAKQELADLQKNDMEVAQALQAVAAAEGAIEEAEMMLYIHNSSPSEDDIYTAYASLLFKEKEYYELKDQLARLEYEYKKTKGGDARKRIRAQIETVTAQMYNQQIVVEEALYRYETIDDAADSLDLDLAQAQLNTAQAELDQANLDLAEVQSGPRAGDISQAKARVAEAQAEWERLQDGPNPQDVLLAETQLGVSQLELQLAEQESLVVDLIAPMDGTVMAINADVNEYIADDSIVTLADTSKPLVEVNLDETDYQSVQVGNMVQVTFDALPDQVFSGSIMEISPDLGSTFGSQVIKALAILDWGSDANLALPIGLNASVEVIAGETSDAVLVPIEALREINPGSYIVNVQVNGVFESRDVTVGLMDFTSAEITNGLEVGDIVLIGGQ